MSVPAETNMELTECERQTVTAQMGEETSPLPVPCGGRVGNLGIAAAKLKNAISNSRRSMLHMMLSMR